MKQVSPVKEAHLFQPHDLAGGHVALDFVNTITGWNGTPRDWLADAEALTRWAELAGVLTGPEADHLRALYRAQPAVAEAVIAASSGLRAALYVVLEAAGGGAVPPRSALSTIEKAWHEASAAARLDWEMPAGPTLIVPADDPHVVTHRVVLAFLRLEDALGSPRLRRCAGDNCGWYFLDTSKAGRRRWCDMATCGNAAKYARTRDVATP